MEYIRLFVEGLALAVMLGILGGLFRVNQLLEELLGRHPQFGSSGEVKLGYAPLIGAERDPGAERRVMSMVHDFNRRTAR